jgi:hypothetical protein
VKIDNITNSRVMSGDGKLLLDIWWKGGRYDGHPDVTLDVPLEGLKSFGYFPDEGRLIITGADNHDLWFRDREMGIGTLTAIASYWLAHVSPDVDHSSTHSSTHGEEKAPGGAEAVLVNAETVLTDEMLALFSSQLENAKPDSLWVMSAPQVAALVETTQRYRQYVRADPAITGEIDDDQLVRWLEQFDRVPSDTLCSITRADLVHLLETTRRYGKIAEALRTLRTIQ